jgi:hypothetical protein
MFRIRLSIFIWLLLLIGIIICEKTIKLKKQNSHGVESEMEDQNQKDPLLKETNENINKQDIKNEEEFIENNELVDEWKSLFGKNESWFSMLNGEQDGTEDTYQVYEVRTMSELRSLLNHLKTMQQFYSNDGENTEHTGSFDSSQNTFDHDMEVKVFLILFYPVLFFIFIYFFYFISMST